MNLLLSTLVVATGLMANITVEWIAEQGAAVADVLYQDWMWSWDQPIPRPQSQVFEVGRGEDDFDVELASRAVRN